VVVVAEDGRLRVHAPDEQLVVVAAARELRGGMGWEGKWGQGRARAKARA
jgi:hypothetical protein